MTTTNVGIKISQKKQIIKLLKYGESINGWVKQLVAKELKSLKEAKKRK